MKIEIIKSRVILSPESPEEKAKLETLWRLLVDCVGDSRKLAPIGEYVPKKGDTGASFHIEGLKPEDNRVVEVRVDEDCSVYCKTCNKIVNLKMGDVIPLCCGQVMVIVD